jgi:hypothetical protein
VKAPNQRRDQTENDKQREKVLQKCREKGEPLNDFKMAAKVREGIDVELWADNSIRRVFHGMQLNYTPFFRLCDSEKLVKYQETPEAASEVWENSDSKVFLLEEDKIKDLGIFNGKLEVKRVKELGKNQYGLFYKAHRGSRLKEGAFIRFYVGELKRESHEDSDYQLVLFGDHDHRQKWVVDSTTYGNEVRFVNHSHRANVEYQMCHFGKPCSLPGALPCLIALRDISDGEELLTNYEVNYSTLQDETLVPCQFVFL